MIIAVDGPTASGKGTIARAIARHYRVPHLDTGALYRAVALAARRSGLSPEDADACAAAAGALDLSLLDDPELRGGATGDLASRIARLPGVRAALLEFQRRFAGQPGGAVLDGRDIGTVIAPLADAKLFVTAAPEIRARRRFLELRRMGQEANEAGVLQDILARDARDMERADAPLARADDAVLLDTGDFDIDAAVRQALTFVSRRLDRTG